MGFGDVIIIIILAIFLIAIGYLYFDVSNTSASNLQLQGIENSLQIDYKTKYEVLDRTIKDLQIKIDSINDVTCEIDAAKSDDLPIGFIFSYPYHIPPSNKYEICDGKQMNKTTYQQLYNVLKRSDGSFPYGENATTFNLPDLKGRFIRGVNTSNQGADTERQVGSIQNSSIGNHKHVLYTSNLPSRYLCSASNCSDQQKSTFYLADQTPVETDAVNQLQGGETRPANMALFYIIKCL